MGGSFDTENRRLTRRATSSDTEWEDAPPGLACDSHAWTFSRGAWRLDGTHSNRHRPPWKPHKRFSGLRMNRTTSELKIALLRSAPAPWSIEFLGSRKIRVTPPTSRQSLFAKPDFSDPYGSHQKWRA
jgi:hypothetical protein